jgi:hypothetical protein
MPSLNVYLLVQHWFYRYRYIAKMKSEAQVKSEAPASLGLVGVWRL